MTGEYPPEVVEDLKNMVAQALPHWDLSPRTAISLLNLSENATFALLDPSTGRDLVLRLHRVGYSSAPEIRSELAWIDALRHERIVETAAPQRGRDNEWVQILESPSGGPSRHAVAFERLPGEAPDGGADAVNWFERLGELTARMHRHARQWSLPAGFRRKCWNLAGMVGPDAYWGPWQAAIGLDAAGMSILERTLAHIRRRLDAFGATSERFGLVHADLRLANLLVDGEHLRIIDFDDCGFGWFAYDFAAAVSFIEHEPIVPNLLEAWITGYRKAAPLLAEECDEIPTFVVLRRILLTAWLASHDEVPFARNFGARYTVDSVTLAEQLLAGEFLKQNPR